MLSTGLLSEEQIKRAKEFLKNHTKYVNSLALSTVFQIPPSLNEDKNNPSLWKDCHWAWFLAHLKD